MSVTKSQNSSIFGLMNHFIPGVTAASAAALLDLEQLYTKISNDYQKLFMSQSKVQSKVATASGEEAESTAQKQAYATRDAGIGQLGQGVSDFAGGTIGCAISPNVSEFQSEIDGAKTYLNELKNPQTLDAVASTAEKEEFDLEGFVKEKTDPDYKFSGKTLTDEDKQAIAHLQDTEDFTKVKAHLESVISSNEDSIKSAMAEAERKTNNISYVTRGVGAAFNGGFQMGSAQETEASGRHQADKTLYDAALSQAQAQSAQLQQQSNQSQQEVQTINTELQQISQANVARG